MVSPQPFELLHFPKHAKAHHLQSHRGSVTLNMPISIPNPVIHRLTDLSVTVHSFYLLSRHHLDDMLPAAEVQIDRISLLVLLYQ